MKTKLNKKQTKWAMIIGAILIVGFLAVQMKIINLQAGTSSVTVCLKNSATGTNICGGRVCVWNTFSDCYICQNTQSNGCTPTFTGAFTSGQSTINIVGNYQGLTNPSQSYSVYLTSGSYTKTYSISSSTSSSSKCGQIEYYCTDQSKCGGSSPTTTTTIQGCSDSDGKNYNVKGTTCNTQYCFEDRCVEAGFVGQEKVEEGYCSSGTLKTEEVFCPSGYCSNGACTSGTCSETDGGIDYTTKGSVTLDSVTKTDQCFSEGGNQLTEWYCSSGSMLSKAVDCTQVVGSGYKCLDGRCVSGGQTTTTKITTTKVTTTHTTYPTTTITTTTVQCSQDSQCPTGWTCKNNVCTPPCACTKDADCETGKVCKECACVTPDGCKIFGIDCNTFNILTVIAVVIIAAIWYLNKGGKKRR